MKTALQELIDEIKLIEAYPMNPLVLRIATDLLEKEKEQILRAFELGMHECLAYDANSIKYYNQTYKQTNGIEDDEIKFIKKQLENIEHYKRGYNAAQTNLYTEKQLTQAMLEMCEYIIDAFERRILIDTNEKAKYIIKSLKLKK